MAEENAPIDISGRQLPYSQEAEQAVIGSALTKEESLGEAAEIITADDFYFLQNRLIFGVMMELFNENSPIDFVSVSDRLGRYDYLETVGGVSYLRDVANVPTTYHVEYYSNIIKEMSMRRKLIDSAKKIADMSYGDGTSVDRVLERSEQLIYDVSSADSGDILPITEIMVGAYKKLIEDSGKGGGLTGMGTGFIEVNKCTGGFHGGELILIAGRPGMGKSSFAVNIAEHVSIYDKRAVAIFNLEMPREQIVNRIICSQALVDSNKIRTGSLTGEDWEKIGAVINRVASAPIYIDDTASITVSQIRAKCRRLKQTKDLQLVIIDYLQLMQSSGRSENRQQEIAEISRSLKILAKELNIPVIALSQLSRASVQRADKRPVLSDLRESGAIEQDADMVMFIYREDPGKKSEGESSGVESTKAECIVAKNRSGATKTFELAWQGAYTKFSNIEYGAVEETV